MIIGVPSAPRFVETVDPRESDTDTTIVTLYPSSAKPDGILVRRVGDVDQDEDNRFTSTDSLQGADKTDESVGWHGAWPQT